MKYMKCYISSLGDNAAAAAAAVVSFFNIPCYFSPLERVNRVFPLCQKNPLQKYEYGLSNIIHV